MLDVKNISRSKIPAFSYEKIMQFILGKKYDLSLVFVNEKLSEELHKKWQNKDGPANVLSFPLDKNSGEIFICPTKAKKDGLKISELFIHGCLHLKGLKHGKKMDSEEKRVFAKFFHKN